MPLDQPRIRIEAREPRTITLPDQRNRMIDIHRLTAREGLCLHK